MERDRELEFVLELRGSVVAAHFFKESMDAADVDFCELAVPFEQRGFQASAYAYEMSDGPWVLRLPRVGEKELQAMIHRWQLRFPHAELSVRSRGLPPPR